MPHASPRAADRRRFIQLLGGGLVLAAAPTVPGCTGMPAEAISAWSPDAAETDPRRFILARALLAPNPHNRQPWVADLRRPGEITLVCDADRLLPATDPFGRQIVVGCGAFIELAVIAAAERGIRLEVQPFPAGEPGPRELPAGRAVARLVLHDDPATPRDPLFAQIPRRHTHKGAYDDARTVAPGAWAALRKIPQAGGLLAGEVIDAGAVQRVKAIARTAYEIECTTPATWLESAHLMRIGPTAIATHRDGIAINDSLPRVMNAIGVFDPLQVPVRATASFDRVMDRWKAMETGSGFFWIASEGNTRPQQLASGRAYVRAHLQATALGLDMHPLSQALQEFAEMRGPYEELHRVLGFTPPGTTVQMLARVGYGVAAAQPAPRRGLAGLLLLAAA
jgi:hypothetical protein